MRHSGGASATVSQSVNSVTAAPEPSAPSVAALLRGADTSDTSRHLENAPSEVSRCARSVNAPGERHEAPAATEPAASIWGEAEEERAAIIQHDGGIPRTWAEGFARLHPDRPLGDVPLHRWQRFVDDVGRFLDSPFCAVAAALGWGPYDLFGCDRDRPFARLDQQGLLWSLNGDRLVAFSENTATIETRTGARQTFRRQPTEPGRVLAWELSP
jgi:hypothetical protein